MYKLYLALAAVFGALSVILGAFAAHGLKSRLDDYAKGIWETAVQYQTTHALALMILAILMKNYVTSSSLKVAGISWVIGIVIFSGSLYCLALTRMKWLGAITPIGGVAFIVGWLALLIFAIKGYE
ncbi:DUF423 domain-containing protein [Pleionea sediminis]|uniref:DUF423 domain-containing protein n=1 Tax=Pleionea sediminis TaxID=2569479 RepID=UPI0011871EA0|nr:DUF423 domain-containing protein [Pleionea sediminis]